MSRLVFPSALAVLTLPLVLLNMAPAQPPNVAPTLSELATQTTVEWLNLSDTTLAAAGIDNADQLARRQSIASDSALYSRVLMVLTLAQPGALPPESISDLGFPQMPSNLADGPSVDSLVTAASRQFAESLDHGSSERLRHVQMAGRAGLHPALGVSALPTQEVNRLAEDRVARRRAARLERPISVERASRLDAVEQLPEVQAAFARCR